MEIRTKDETLLRRYLLGTVSSQEQEELELWLMSNNDAYDLLEAAEDDLIDDALAGRLTQPDLDLFNSRFLAAPERQRKFQFSLSFKRAMESSTRAASATEPSSSSLPNFLIHLLDTLRYRPSLVYIAAALILALAIGSGWSIVKIAELQSQLRSTAAQLNDAGRDRDNIKHQLDETQTATRTLETQVRTLDEALAAATSSVVRTVATLTLLPGLTRSSSEIPKLTLNANTSFARFSLALTDDNFTSFRVSLQNAEGREIWSRNKIAASKTPDGKAIVLNVPAAVLSNGDFSFSVMGIPDSGSPESIGRYSFRTIRQ